MRDYRFGVVWWVEGETRSCGSGGREDR